MLLEYILKLYFTTLRVIYFKANINLITSDIEAFLQIQKKKNNGVYFSRNLLNQIIFKFVIHNLIFNNSQ